MDHGCPREANLAIGRFNEHDLKIHFSNNRGACTLSFKASPPISSRATFNYIGACCPNVFHARATIGRDFRRGLSTLLSLADGAVSRMGSTVQE